MDVGDVVAVLDGVEAEFVGRAVDDAPLDPAAGHPDGEAEDVVVAPVRPLRAGGAAELGGEDHERLVEQAALVQVLEQAADRLVNGQGVLLVVGPQRAVGVPGPGAAAAVLNLDEANAPFSNAAGELQALGARIVQREHLPADTPVILIGYSSGATVVYAALAQAKKGQFAGGLSLGFCPDLIIHKPFCPGANHLTAHRDPKPPHTPNFDRADHLGAPWRVLQGEVDQVCAPHFSPDFAKPLHDAKVWMLPHVGHGFGKPKNWLPQYHAALRSLPASSADR